MTSVPHLHVALPATGSRSHHREAVRAVAVDEAGRLLMLTERSSAGLKFPGGGVEPGEDHVVALARELKEETGYALRGPATLAVVVSEVRPGVEPDVVLLMESRYYLADMAERGATSLEDDEVALGLEAVWLPLADALARQRTHVESAQAQPWSHRELAVLEWLAGSDLVR